MEDFSSSSLLSKAEIQSDTRYWKPCLFPVVWGVTVAFPSKKTVFRVWNMPVFDVFACRWSLLLRHALVYFEGKNAVSVWWRFVKSGFLSPSSSFSRVKMPFFAANLSEREPIRESVGCMSATFMLSPRSVGTGSETGSINGKNKPLLLTKCSSVFAKVLRAYAKCVASLLVPMQNLFEKNHNKTQTQSVRM